MGQVDTQLRTSKYKMMSADDQAQYCSSLQDLYVYVCSTLRNFTVDFELLLFKKIRTLYYLHTRLYTCG